MNTCTCLYRVKVHDHAAHYLSKFAADQVSLDVQLNIIVCVLKLEFLLVSFNSIGIWCFINEKFFYSAHLLTTSYDNVTNDYLAIRIFEIEIEITKTKDTKEHCWVAMLSSFVSREGRKLLLFWADLCLLFIYANCTFVSARTYNL